jgi:hypothetical protein
MRSLPLWSYRVWDCSLSSRQEGYTKAVDGNESQSAAEQKTPSYPKNYDAVPHNYHKESHGRRNAFIVMILVALLLAGGGYWFFLHKKPVKSVTTSQSSQTSAAVPTNKINAKTKNYESTNFSLSFDYPEDWKVSDATGSGKLTATSPVMQLAATDNQPVTGQIVLTIRDASQKLTEFDKGNATAARESEKIAYAKPSSAQRGSTYISFLAYATSADTTVLDGVYVTGDSGYQKGQAIPQVDIAKVNPLITISFVKCSDNNCSGTGTPLSTSYALWDDATISGPLKTMFESLVVN